MSYKAYNSLRNKACLLPFIKYDFDSIVKLAYIHFENYDINYIKDVGLWN